MNFLKLRTFRLSSFTETRTKRLIELELELAAKKMTNWLLKDSRELKRRLCTRLFTPSRTTTIPVEYIV